MINYSDLTDYLKLVASRNPNFNFVDFGPDDKLINSPQFDTPAFVISPAQINLQDMAVINYGFQLLYLDKMRQEEDNYNDILQDAIQNISSYLQFVDWKYKIIWGFGADPFLFQYDGGLLAGIQSNILVQDQYNIDVTKTPYYNIND